MTSRTRIVASLVQHDTGTEFSYEDADSEADVSYLCVSFTLCLKRHVNECGFAACRGCFGNRRLSSCSGLGMAYDRPNRPYWRRELETGRFGPSAPSSNFNSYETGVPYDRGNHHPSQHHGRHFTHSSASRSLSDTTTGNADYPSQETRALFGREHFYREQEGGSGTNQVPGILSQELQSERVRRGCVERMCGESECMRECVYGCGLGMTKQSCFRSKFGTSCCDGKLTSDSIMSMCQYTCTLYTCMYM